jgi:hypothetical protein
MTHDQLDKINKTYLELDRSYEINHSLKEENLLLKQADSLCEVKSSKLKESNSILLRVDGEREEQLRILTQENKKQQKRINVLKKSRTLFSIGAFIIGSVSTYFVVQQIN